MDLFPKLCHGDGNGIDTACLMTASNMLIGKGHEGNNNSCVCPIIRQFIIQTNDAMPEDLLQELYGPLAIEIIGTRNDDPVVRQQRGFTFADWSVREVVPLAFDIIGRHDHAATLRALSEISSQETAHAAAHVDAVAHVVHVATAYAVHTAIAAANVAHAAAHAAAHGAADTAIATARIADAADVAARVAHVTTNARAANIWRLCPEIIRRVAAIGDLRLKERVPLVMTMDELCEVLR